MGRRLMSSSTSPGIAVRQGGDLLEITFDRPERRNALGDAEWSLLERLAREAADSPVLEFVVLRGTGEYFCAGVDLAQIEAAKARPGGITTVIGSNGRILDLFEQLPQLVTVALNGPAVGIGVHFALNADFVFARESAFFWLPEAKLGIPDVLHYRVMERRLGRHGALAAILLGRRLPAGEALARGIVGSLLADEDALNAAIVDHLRQLRTVPLPVRRVVKSYIKAAAGSSDPLAQISAANSVMFNPQN